MKCMKAEKSDVFTVNFSNGEEGLFHAMSSAEQACLEHGIDSKNIFLVNLCMEELVTNALRYGSKGKPVIHFQIAIEFTKPGITLKISDDAHPFNPLVEAPIPDLEADIEDRMPGGLGIHLLKSMTGSIQYKYKNNKNIVFIKI